MRRLPARVNKLRSQYHGGPSTSRSGDCSSVCRSEGTNRVQRTARQLLKGVGVLAGRRVGPCGLVGLTWVASISITGKDGRIQTLAPTDEVARRGDALQYELGEGPCLDVVFEEPVVQVDDVGTDLRWPRYGRVLPRSLGSGRSWGFSSMPSRTLAVR
ncbi:hypothetical protein Kfla_1455 [Kribbella flavida DSM 17836]|uniref:Uncharacterized protein n=1 Tax=Kribbella flavida (strain DSM 17836 / JCM 10339 / NBRC 14399) TaxID=479435 RepID=D2PLC7_KRIFD|nr:hypothetical protein [Kribbella flavida]ADB30556.1 hypothetical protein Kfla_1455 [Kribbella flavida DSM 17836]